MDVKVFKIAQLAEQVMCRTVSEKTQIEAIKEAYKTIELVDEYMEYKHAIAELEKYGDDGSDWAQKKKAIVSRLEDKWGDDNVLQLLTRLVEAYERIDW